MNENQTESYARRTKKYHDKSNFGGYDEQDVPKDADDEYTAPSGQPIEKQEKQYSTKEQPELDNWPTIERKTVFEDLEASEEPEELEKYSDFGKRRAAKKHSSAKRAKKKGRRREVLGWIVSIVVAVSAALLIRAFIFEIILVDGASMYPTLYTDERVAVEKVTRYTGMPDRGDVIIVEYPNRPGTYVKRAIGLPGETIEIRNSIVHINGEPLVEDYINKNPYNDMAAVTVPENHVFVMGDNRERSLDSRTEDIGPIPHEAIVGHGLFVIWPPDKIHAIH